jgi:hypothetical protein
LEAFSHGFLQGIYGSLMDEWKEVKKYVIKFITGHYKLSRNNGQKIVINDNKWTVWKFITVDCTGFYIQKHI